MIMEGAYEPSFYEDRDERIDESVPVPDGLEIDCAYTDRMSSWDRDKYEEACKHLDHRFQYASDDALRKFCSVFFEREVVEVRVVFYFNVATGYDCPRIDYLYKKEDSDG